LLCQTELDLKRIQIDYAPAGVDVFININSHAIRFICDIEADAML